MRPARFLLPPALALTVLLSAAAEARVVSYAPVTDRKAIPALQRRTNRSIVLLESETFSISYPGGGGGGGVGGGVPNPSSGLRGRLVVHDTTGAREPRVVLPVEGAEATFTLVAAQEAADGSLRILAATDVGASQGTNGTAVSFRLSTDGGSSWHTLELPGSLVPASTWIPIWSPGEDFGGPFSRGRNPYVRVGSDPTPFVVLLASPTTGAPTAVAGVKADGTVRLLADLSSPQTSGSYASTTLIGGDASRETFLVEGRVAPVGSAGPAVPPFGVYRVGTNGSVARLLELASDPYTLEGWLTPDGSTYLELDWGSRSVPSPFTARRSLALAQGGLVREVAVAPASGSQDPTQVRYGLFAIPNAAVDGAWILQRGPGLPTVLSSHRPGGALVEKWRDVTAPEVEALHAGAAGTKLLVQVHRPRPQMDQRIFKDPALAVWDDGTQAPRQYDELFLNEQADKGFVHLDVDALEAGAPFLFDSGVPLSMTGPVGGGPSSGGGAGGADVTQEWGVVKGSLLQRLVIPAVARAPGAGGAFWKTDLVLRNPDLGQPLSVKLRLALTGGGAPREATLTLAPASIRVVPDALAALFGVETGSGALFLDPSDSGSVEATSRTYTTSPRGTYGMGVGAVDTLAASTARFGVTFAAALQGPDYRTNVGAADTGGRGAEVSLRAAGDSGWMGRDDFSFAVSPSGHAQLNGLAGWLGVPDWRAGGLAFQPRTGEVVPFLVAIDNRTNDPTYFPPDLPSPTMRAIPALVHTDGASGARFRSDLFLLNTSDQLATVQLLAKRWDSAESETIVSLTLLPHESKTIRDALSVIFGKTGVARLRFQSPGTATGAGVRVTSRTYAVEADGGTYGLVLPPLNAFQAAGSGEALEILGPTGGPRLRTNLALVELTPFSTGGSARVRVEVLDGTGRLLDGFDVNVPVAGGMQIDDLFRARGLGDGPEAALLRVLPAAGLVGAYATTIDQGTNDPSYFAAGLAARD